MDSPNVAVLPVPKGSIVWMHNTWFMGDDDKLQDLLLYLVGAIGHNEFCLVHTAGEGDVKVFGSPEEAVVMIRASLR